jgi:hypothetical protein
VIDKEGAPIGNVEVVKLVHSGVPRAWTSISRPTKRSIPAQKEKKKKKGNDQQIKQNDKGEKVCILEEPEKQYQGLFQ